MNTRARTTRTRRSPTRRLDSRRARGIVTGMAMSLTRRALRTCASGARGAVTRARTRCVALLRLRPAGRGRYEDLGFVVVLGEN